MTQDNELPRITCDEDWLDLRDGELAFVAGRMNSAGDGIVVPLTYSWRDIFIATLKRLTHQNVLSLVGETVRVVVRRTEDGIEGVSIRTEGGVPIPLVSETVRSPDELIEGEN
jgi:hypothetical protein